MPLKQPETNGITETSEAKFILLGEDDIDDEEMLKEVFMSIDRSFALRFFNIGRKLVEAIVSLPHHDLPCLIVLDYNMPEMNGAEILKVLREHERFHPIPKIIWSTSGSDIYKSVCLELGACDYITKPSNMKDLTEAARYMLSFCPT